MQNSVLHLDLDAFFASVEVQKNSAWRGRPLIVGGQSRRGVVASCSYEARAFGVRSAMPMQRALMLCPDAVVVKGDFEAYEKKSGEVRQIIEEEAPLFEQASIDEFYLDLTGLDRYFGCQKWSLELREKIMRETGLPISQGLSTNKTVSKVGTGEAKPNGWKLIPTGEERAFLAPLAVGKLPGVGPETGRRLNFMGVRQIRTLAEIPPVFLEREFGKHGIDLWKKANGEDKSPVVPHREQESVSTETTFQTDSIDPVFLENELRKMASRLAFDLRSRQKLASVVTVKIRYSDFQTYTRQLKISPTASDSVIRQTAIGLFERLFERRQLVRLVGLRLGGLTGGLVQLDLFDDTPRETRLLEAMDKIRRRFGGTAVRMGGG